MSATFQNPHIILLSLALLIGAIAALIHAVKAVYRPVMTDRQWRCFMDANAPPHSCPRCRGSSESESV